MRGPMHTAPVPRRRAATIQSDVFIHTTFTDRRYWSQRWPGPERLKAESHQLLDRAHPGRSILAKSLVPLAGLEPARCCHHLILSQARLPIPPQGQAGGIIAAKREGSTGPHVLSVSLLSSRSLIRSSGPWVSGSRCARPGHARTYAAMSAAIRHRRRRPGRCARDPRLRHLGTRPFTAFARAA